MRQRYKQYDNIRELNESKSITMQIAVVRKDSLENLEFSNATLGRI